MDHENYHGKGIEMVEDCDGNCSKYAFNLQRQGLFLLSEFRGRCAKPKVLYRPKVQQSCIAAWKAAPIDRIQALPNYIAREKNTFQGTQKQDINNCPRLSWKHRNITA